MVDAARLGASILRPSLPASPAAAGRLPRVIDQVRLQRPPPMEVGTRNAELGNCVSFRQKLMCVAGHPNSAFRVPTSDFRLTGRGASIIADIDYDARQLACQLALAAPLSGAHQMYPLAGLLA